MLSNGILKALNEQIQVEMNSAYLYLSMAAYFEDENLPGFAQWMRIQFSEEQSHGLRLFDYLSARGGRIALGSLEKPPENHASPTAVFEAVLKHEQYVTGTIDRLYEMALNEKDHATQTQMHWFINEQVEEEKTAHDILEQLKAFEGHRYLLLEMDRHMGQRTSVQSDEA